MNWISVKDRLPEEREVVLVWGKDGCRAHYEVLLAYLHILTPDINYWYREENTFHCDGNLEEEVTHWMPLPDAPADDHKIKYIIHNDKWIDNLIGKE